MGSACDLQAVVVSCDPMVVNSISSCLNELGITAAVHRETSSAMQTLSRQKTDAFFVDRELDPEFSVLSGMRRSTSSRGAVGFAIVPREAPAGGAFRVADFVIDKPLASSRVNRTLRAAYGIMLKERMRYFRHSFRTEATLVDATYRRFLAQTSNISQTGIALECAAPLTARESVQLQFCLPCDQEKLNCKAQIIWIAEKGKAGLTFTQMSNADKERLTAWIEAEFHRTYSVVLPGGAAARMSHATA